MQWQFRVPGRPIPQPRPKISTRGGFGRAYVEAKHPIHAYRRAIAAAASGTAWWGVSDGAWEVEIEAVFQRPQSHLTRRGVRRSAPRWPPRVDWDNLGKGVCDALTGVVWKDDDQVIDGRVKKRFAVAGEEPHTLVTLRSVGHACEG